MKTFNKIISYVSLFAFLLSLNACTSTEYLYDTPQRILRGDSDVELDNGLYKLQSISLYDNREIQLKNYSIKFIEKPGKGTYFVYFYPKNLFVDSLLMAETNFKITLYKKPVADTLNIKDIETMHYIKNKVESSTIVLLSVIGIPLAIFVGALIGRGKF